MDLNLSRRKMLSAVGTVTLIGAAPASASAERPDDRATATEQNRVRRDNFTVRIDGAAVPGWHTVAIPSVSVEEGTYREGDGRDWRKKTWGRSTFDDLEMERGFRPEATELHDWFEAVRRGDVEEGRKAVAVVLRNEEDNPVIEWEFDGAWISEYDPPKLDATGEATAATESVVVAFETMQIKWAP